MRVGVFTDLRFTGSRTMTGVGKHIINMVRGLASAPGLSLSVIAAIDQLHTQGAVPPENAMAGLPARGLPLAWKQAETLWTVTGRPFADRWCGGVDWVYCPKNDIIPLKRTRLAVTIHGAHQLDPQMSQNQTVRARLNCWRQRARYGRIVENAEVVLTVSEFLRAQVVDWFKVQPDRVVVIGNGVEREFFEVQEKRPDDSSQGKRRPYILCVGGLNYLDGGDRILKVASLLSERLPDVEILIAGWQHEEQLRRAAASLSNIKVLGYVQSAALAGYMRDALALLLPTRYETFGIAAAEAMAVGAPVVTCRSTAVPEVVADAGIYVDPDQPEAVIEAILRLLSEPSLRNDLIARGRQRARAYTWSACVSRLQQILEKG